MPKNLSQEGGILIKFLIFFILLSFYSTANAQSARLQKLLRSKEDLKIQNVLIEKESARRFYNKFGNELVWFESDGSLKPNTKKLIVIIEDSKKEGLEPKDYNLELLKEISAKPSKKELIEKDIIFSHSAILYTQHIVFGRKKPEGTQLGVYYKDKEKQKEIRARTPEYYLHQALLSEDFAKYLNLLLPQHENYTALKKLLAELEGKIDEDKNFAPIRKGEDIKAEVEDKRMPAIRQRLKDLKFYKASGVIANENKNFYEEDLYKAVKSFQKAMGIDENGKITAIEIKLLNLKIADKIKLVKTNLERWRWIKRDLGEKYVVVNLPAYNLKAYKNREQILDMNAIVGTPDKQTPMLSTYVTDVILNPFWHVPKRIAIENLLPQLIEDPQHVKNYGFEFIKQTESGKWVTEPEGKVNVLTLDSKNFPYLLRQKPGYLNSLGKVRFSIFSDYGVYLHGTPDHSYFALDDRAFSSGCVRLEYPLDLIYFMLEGEKNWPKKKIREFYYQNASSEGENLRSINITLKDEIPVHFIYQTIWKEKDGTIAVREDSYKYDYMMILDYKL
jgi:murein L,D-transpeptidase YcbB/YkuD